jgi:transcriptional regulator with XRE-family HTH domain
VATEPVASLRTKEYDALRSILREARLARGISQEILSKSLGRPITFIGKIEQGTRRLDLIELMEICDSLEIEVEKVVQEIRARCRS